MKSPFLIKISLRFVGILAIFAAWAAAASAVVSCAKYDQLISLDQVCDQRWADVEAQLQRRYDLVPNLVQTVKASAKHEEDTLTQVTQARADATSIHDLQVQLEGTENRILRSREQYNDAVRDYNSELLKIGGQVVHKATGRTFKPRIYFAASADAQVAPKVVF